MSLRKGGADFAIDPDILAHAPAHRGGGPQGGGTAMYSLGEEPSYSFGEEPTYHLGETPLTGTGQTDEVTYHLGEDTLPVNPTKTEETVNDAVYHLGEDTTPAISGEGEAELSSDEEIISHARPSEITYNMAMDAAAAVASSSTSAPPSDAVYSLSEEPEYHLGETPYMPASSSAAGGVEEEEVTYDIGADGGERKEEATYDMGYDGEPLDTSNIKTRDDAPTVEERKSALTSLEHRSVAASSWNYVQNLDFHHPKATPERASDLLSHGEPGAFLVYGSDVLHLAVNTFRGATRHVDIIRNSDANTMSLDLGGVRVDHPDLNALVLYYAKSRNEADFVLTKDKEVHFLTLKRKRKLQKASTSTEL